MPSNLQPAVPLTYRRKPAGVDTTRASIARVYDSRFGCSDRVVAGQHPALSGRCVEMLPVGSFVASSHFWDPGEGAQRHDLASKLKDWWPSGPPVRPRYPEERLMLGGVGYKHLPLPAVQFCSEGRLAASVRSTS